MGSLKFTKGKLLICLVAFAIAIIAVAVFKLSVGNLFYLAVFLVCPLMHLFLMKGKGHKDDTKQTGRSCH